MIVLVFGGNGQVGQELLCVLVLLGVVVVIICSGQLFDGSVCEIVDFGQFDSLLVLLDCVQFLLVVNVVVYIVVDCVEQDVDVVFVVNVQVLGMIVCWCVVYGVLFVYYLIDYVFDGQGSVFYCEDELIVLLGVYGISKCDGEDVVCVVGGCYLIFCMVWVYVLYGVNFLCIMLCVGVECDVLWVVVDQVGMLMLVVLIVDVILQVLQYLGQLFGIWYLIVSGQISWYGFVEVIFVEVLVIGVLVKVLMVEVIFSFEYLILVKCLVWLVLDNCKLQQDFGIVLLIWQDGLKWVMVELV